MSSDLEEIATRWKELITKSLSDLEKWGLTQLGLKEGEKIYRLTDRGRAALKKGVESHFERVSSIRSWFVKILVDLKMIEEPTLFKDMAAAMLPIRSAVLTHLEEQSNEGKIEALEKMKKGIQDLDDTLNRATERINLKIEELRST